MYSSFLKKLMNWINYIIYISTKIENRKLIEQDKGYTLMQTLTANKIFMT